MWTHDNTTGFSDAELEVINAALHTIRMTAGEDFDAENINAALNNAWSRQENPNDLASAALKLLGR